MLNLENNLQNKIQNLLDNRNLPKPKMITNQCLQDTLIENDLQGKDLFELEKDKIKILSTDLPIFNDEAFRYYLPQFIYFYLMRSEFIVEDMFIQVFFKSNLLNEKTYRFLQFKIDEKEIIVEFLQKIYDEIYNITKTKEYKELKVLGARRNYSAI
ncbi:hypothetical protein [Campylobacter concisus]|uniref:hypothetical protein n=1 Tax=Campylobacter concisus TaxID=199 RepID=UPI00138AFC34|nr:hypothetical protein [Campylobacter concisus]